MAFTTETAKQLRGNRKGVPNKITTDIREAALIAAGKYPGGLEAFFGKMLEEEPAAMLNFLARCLPREVNLGITTSLAALIEESRAVPLARIEELRAIENAPREITNGSETHD